MKSPEELNEFMLVHGEKIVDSMGDEIDRLETKLSVRKLQQSSNWYAITDESFFS